LVAGSYTGSGDSDFALVYRNPRATSPLNALVTAANTTASTGINVTCTVQVDLGGARDDLGSDTLKAFLYHKKTERKNPGRKRRHRPGQARLAHPLHARGGGRLSSSAHRVHNPDFWTQPVPVVRIAK